MSVTSALTKSEQSKLKQEKSLSKEQQQMKSTEIEKDKKWDLKAAELL